MMVRAFCPLWADAMADHPLCQRSAPIVEPIWIPVERATASDHPIYAFNAQDFYANVRGHLVRICKEAESSAREEAHRRQQEETGEDKAFVYNPHHEAVTYLGALHQGLMYRRRNYTAYRRMRKVMFDVLGHTRVWLIADEGEGTSKLHENMD